MRNLHDLGHYRDVRFELKHYGRAGDSGNGVFRFRDLAIIASSGDGWDHVSVSKAGEVPCWDEMERVKRMFFRDDECAMQLHVPVRDHIDCCANCLHLWRPHGVEIPRPPAIMVGPS